MERFYQHFHRATIALKSRRVSHRASAWQAHRRGGDSRHVQCHAETTVGRLGQHVIRGLLITLLVEQWGLLSSPLLYVSLGFKRHQQEYYERLSRVRTHGDWEGWIEFFLRCVIESADDGVTTAQRLFPVVGEDRLKAIQHKSATVNSLRLFELLPQYPVVTLARAGELLAATKPTTQKAIDSLCAAGVLHEVTGRKRDRVYAWRSYIDVLGAGTMPIPR